MDKKIDITPTPRILTILGDIPFDVWQCIAELTDNSLDSFSEQKRLGEPINNARIDIYWSKENTSDLEIVIEDNGPGMSIDELQNATRAGFTSNDPIHNLGLFGMGFNISTARLGDETIISSATKDSREWVGIKIDFGELISNHSFEAPIINEPKDRANESGTRIRIRKIKSGIYKELIDKASSIRRRLEIIYSPVIERKEVDIYLQGNILTPRLHCIWGENRYVTRRNGKIYAFQRIDRDFGEAWFDIKKNRYLSEDESAEFTILESKGKQLSKSPSLIKRSRRLKGWLGIQRYTDTSNYGIDFVRNGRKILINDKKVFEFENPETGSFIQEYPIDLATAWGGRIVGELHVDYLIPSYQKNSFDTSDISWRLTIEAIRGAGPLLQNHRKRLDYDDINESVLAILVNAYRRQDPGIKNLALPRDIASKYRKKFEKPEQEYIPDEKWYRAVQNVDQNKENPSIDTSSDTDEAPSDDPESYLPTGRENEATDDPEVTQSSGSSKKNDLINNSEIFDLLCGDYSYGGKYALEISARRMVDAQIKTSNKRMPYEIFIDGVEIDFIFDDTHPLIAEYPFSIRQLLIQALVDIFVSRDDGIRASEVFVGLLENHLSDERINNESLKRRAQLIINNIQESLPDLLSHRHKYALEIIKQVPLEVEVIAEKLIDERPELLNYFQQDNERANEAFAYIPIETIIRLVDKIPEEFLDGKVFNLPYKKINLGAEDVNERLRKLSIEKIVNCLRDISSLLKVDPKTTKHELIRYSTTLSILEDRLE